MLKGGKSTVLTLAEKCKNILVSNWQGSLNSIKADAKGSKEEIYTSKVKYFVKKGKPFIWIPEKDLHNVNLLIDERSSFAVSSPFPGPLASLLKSIEKLPARVALMGDTVRLNEEKAKLVTESFRETLLAEQNAVQDSSYSVSGILNSSCVGPVPRSTNLLELLEGNEQYSVYKFNMSSCTYIDCNRGVHEVNVDDIEESKADSLSHFSMSLIDGINQSEVRRRALVLFCINYLNINAKDVLLLSMDRKGFDVLAKVPGCVKVDGSHEYQWKELRFALKEEARDLEAFCNQLLQMEEDALHKISHLSGL